MGSGGGRRKGRSDLWAGLSAEGVAGDQQPGEHHHGAESLGGLMGNGERDADTDNDDPEQRPPAGQADVADAFCPQVGPDEQ